MNKSLDLNSSRDWALWRRRGLVLALCLSASIAPAAIITWTNTAGGNWTAAGNWSPNTVPGSADTAFITNGGTYTVTVNGAANVGELIVGGIIGTQTVSVAGTSPLTMVGASVFEANGRLSLGSSLAVVNSSNLLTFNGTFAWVSGALQGAGDLVLNAPQNFTSSNGKQLVGKRLVNHSIVTISNANVGVNGTASVSNAPAGVFEFTSDHGLGTAANASTLVNYGLIRKSAGSGSTQLYPNLVNYGTVEVQTGTVVLNGTTATNFNLVTVAAGTRLNVSPATSGYFPPGASVTGAGDFEVSSGTVTVDGLIGVTGTNTFSGGNTTINGTNHIGGTLAISGSGTVPVTFNGDNYSITGPVLIGGTLTLNGTGNVSPSSVVIRPAGFSGGGTLGGSNLVTVNGPLIWRGGVISGTNAVIVNGTFVSSNAVAKSLSGRTLVINGNALIAADGGFSAGGSCLISNAPGATWEFAADQTIGVGAGSGRFINNGTVLKSAGAGQAVFGIPFTNASLVQVDSGTLRLDGSGTQTGTFNLGPAGALDISPNSGFSMAPESVVSGAGNLIISGVAALSGLINVTGTNSITAGTANFLGSYAITNGVLNIAGTANFNGDGIIHPSQLNLSGTLGGSNSVIVNGPFNWTAGNISGTNAVIANGGLNISQVASKSLSGRTLINQSNALMSHQISLANGAVLSNAPGAMWDLTEDFGVTPGSGSGTVVNGGLFRKTGGTTSATIDVPFRNYGTVEVQTAALRFGNSGVFTQFEGLTSLNGGNITNLTPLRIQGGVVAGNGIISGSVTNGGTFHPGTSPGQLIIGGSYLQTANGTLAIELAGSPATTNYDRLIASGGFRLDGALVVTLTSNYYPAPDVVFTNLISGSLRTNTFATFSFPSNVVGLQLNYAATNVDLEVVNTLPSLPPIAPQNVNELVLLSLNAGASDADAPAQTLSYSLLNSPAGASINGAGQITWTPTESQGPISTNITVAVTDNGTPNLTTNITFAVTANEINVAPVLNVPGTQIVTEQTPLTGVSVSATDSDVPVNPITYSLVAPPGGMTINPASGAIAWTPTEAQGSNIFTITVVATDTNALAINPQSLSTTNTFNIIVNESNRPPVLAVPANQTLTEENALTGVSASATDPDSPANALTYSLVSPPSGLIINPSSGAFTWTPTESQGSNTYTVTVVVTDTNPPAVNTKSFNVTNAFTITVNESNRPPVLTPPANQILTEETPLTGVAASATDPDSPANALTYSLLSPPGGMTINAASGLIAWTPTEAQGSNLYTVTVVVADTNPPAVNTKAFSVTNTFTVTVNESNRPPVLTLPTNATINELVAYANTASATDPDSPLNLLTYALISGPTGLVVNASSGAINWMPSEFQGPGTYPVQIRVTDTNSMAINPKSLSVTNSYTLTVGEVNVAPVVGALAPQSGNPGQTISFTATATDADLPTNTLSFSLVSPPAGASIGAGSGLFSWRLPAGLANTTNTLSIRVTDSGFPNLSGTNNFSVAISPISPVILTPLDYSGGAFRLSVTGSLGPDYVLQGSSTLSGFTDLVTNTPLAMPFNFTNASISSNRFYRVRLNP
jgi:hypothetical protein